MGGGPREIRGVGRTAVSLQRNAHLCARENRVFKLLRFCGRGQQLLWLRRGTRMDALVRAEILQGDIGKSVVWEEWPFRPGETFIFARERKAHSNSCVSAAKPARQSERVAEPKRSLFHTTDFPRSPPGDLHAHEDIRTHGPPKPQQLLALPQKSITLPHNDLALLSKTWPWPRKIWP